MCMFVYMWVGIGHTHNDEEHRSGNVSHVNRVDDEGYGLARFHVSHVVPRMTPPITKPNPAQPIECNQPIQLNPTESKYETLW